MRTDTIELASATILAAGTARDREVRAYLLARGRFADVIALASSIGARTGTGTARPILRVVA